MDIDEFKSLYLNPDDLSENFGSAFQPDELWVRVEQLRVARGDVDETWIETEDEDTETGVTARPKRHRLWILT